MPNKPPNPRRIDFPYPGHFICADRCFFRLHTHIGPFCISTVGDMHIEEVGHAEPLGAGEESLYETLVFDTQRKANRFSEIDGRRYGGPRTAQEGHEKLVAKYAKLALDTPNAPTADDCNGMFEKACRHGSTP